MHFVSLHFKKCNNQWIVVRRFREISSADAGFKIHTWVKCLQTLQDLHSVNLRNFRLTAFKKIYIKKHFSNSLNQTNVAEEYCWVDTGGKTVMLWPIKFQCVGVWL